ncbi:MAG: diguanylate cyclase [Deltaproteobacteria bacterium]|nr:diguanylate cyclase [Deltaproteobacteria bacterium]
MSNFFPILIAEDNPVSRKFLEKSLVRGGYTVMAAENGREALEILDKDFFPIVITDWMMPEKNGLELCRAIRSHTFPGYVFIVLLTANDSKEDVIAGLEAGADDYLTKPFNYAELMARLNAGKRILQLERSLKMANEEIRILSITDSLTKIYNRVCLTERLPREISRAKRYGHTMSLIMCDIDHFKKVNDSYGHHAGDITLKAFADCLKQSIRDNVDWVARYGGEEFLIVLPETSLEGACQTAERIRRGVSEMVINIEGEEISITASFGLSSFNSSEHNEKSTPESMIEQADKCMYQAKKNGRNRVEGEAL